jgi:hypothetical protein
VSKGEESRYEDRISKRKKERERKRNSERYTQKGMYG